MDFLTKLYTFVAMLIRLVVILALAYIAYEVIKDPAVVGEWMGRLVGSYNDAVN